MTVLFNSAAPAKPARNARFGAGVLASRPVYSAPYTTADLQWLAEDAARRENERFDRMAAEAAVMGRYESGLMF